MRAGAREGGGSVARGVKLRCGCSATDLGLHRCEEARALTDAAYAYAHSPGVNVVVLNEMYARVQAHWKQDGAVAYHRFLKVMKASRHKGVGIHARVHDKKRAEQEEALQKALREMERLVRDAQADRAKGREDAS